MMDRLLDINRAIFGLTLKSEETGVGQMCARALLVYVALIVIVRFGKKRFLGKATVFDAILVIIIGSIAARATSRAVSDLEAAGVRHDDISIVSNNSDNWYLDSAPAAGRTTTANTTTTSNKIDRDGDGVDDRAEGAAAGGSIGAGLGGAAGVLAGLGLLAIPGVGPAVAAGWLASLLTGAVAGGAVGGVIGAFSQAGIRKDDAPVYA